jgi:beta-lactam-binding protein with PASTA domain
VKLRPFLFSKQTIPLNVSWANFVRELPGRIKDSVVETGYFVSSKIFLKNLLLFGALMLLFFTVLFFWLNLFTRHGEQVTVPEILKMDLARAEDALDDSDLYMQITDSVWRTGVQPGIVLSQEPRPGTKVKEGRLVYVTVSATRAPMRNLKAILAGSDIKTVRRMLQSLGMEILEEPILDGGENQINMVKELLVDGRTIFRYRDSRFTQDVQLPEGTRVTVRYVQGAGEEDFVPMLLGKSWDEAHFYCASSGYNYTLIPDIDLDTTQDRGGIYVWKQNPMPYPDDKIRKGENIDLYLTRTKAIIQLDNMPTDGEVPLFEDGEQ